MRILTILILALIALPAQAEDKTDHPLISAYEGAKLSDKEVRQFDEYRAYTYLNDEGELDGPTLEGKVTKIEYRNPDNRSILEMYRNYEAALKAEGLEVIHECNQASEIKCLDDLGAKYDFRGYNDLEGMDGRKGRYLFGKISSGDMDNYVAVLVGPLKTSIHIIEAKAMDTGKVSADASVLVAEELEKSIDKKGHVIVEGIYFDTDKATLKPESKLAVSELAKFLNSRPDLKAFIVGHTDMQGNLGYNAKLSKSRANAVISDLVATHGIDKTRLSGQGIGPLAPQATNATEAGRALNRRVVLVAR